MTTLLYLLIGLGIGIIGGMVGIGGGVLLVPALTLLFGMNVRQAAGISLAVLVLPVTLPGAWKYYQQGHLTRDSLATAGLLAAAFALGSFLGAHIQHRLDEHVLRMIFGLLMLYVGMRVLLYGSSEAVHAAAGLTTLVLAWIAFLALRALGRKHLPPPSLGDQIRQDAALSPGADDYYI
jgi:uncharacterized membrane protein YfcA